MANDVTLKVGADTSDATKAFKDLANTVEKTGKDIKEVAKKSSSAWSTFKGVLGAQALIGGLKKVSSSAIDMGKSMITAARQMETIETELTTVTGSADKAKKLLEELNNFAANTPFQLEGIAQATKQLIAFGFEAETIKNRLKVIGDVASGAGVPLKDISLLFGQVSAAGKLMGDRMLQFQEKAIPLGPAIAKTMGIAESAVSDAITKGKVDFATFEKAFNSLTEEGGIFYNSMIEKSKDLDGVMSTLGDNIFLLSAKMGKELLPTFKQLAIALTTFVQKNQKDIVNAFKAMVGAVATLVGWMDRLRKGLGFDKEFNRLKANGDKIEELRRKIKNLSEAVESGKGFFESEAEFQRKKNAILDYQDELAGRLKLNAELVGKGFAGTAGEKFIKNIKKGTEEVKILNTELKKTKDTAEKGILIEIKEKLQAADIGEKIGSSIATNIGRGDAGAKAFAANIGGAAASAIFTPAVGGAVAGLIAFALQEPEVIRAQTKAFVEAIPHIIPGLILGVGALVEGALSVIGDWLTMAGTKFLQPIFAEFNKVFKNTIGQLFSNFGEFITGLFGKLGEGVNNLLKVLVNLPAQVINGIVGIFSRLIEAIKEGVKQALGVGGRDRDNALNKAGKWLGDRTGIRLAEGIASVPQGFPNDTFAASLTSGEEVLNVKDKASIKEDIAMLSKVVAGMSTGAGSGNQTINVELTLDGNVLANTILELNRDNARLTA